MGIAAGMDEFSASARMNHYELGRHTPDYQTLKRIAKILRLPVAYFYAETDDLAKFIVLFSRLKKPLRETLLEELNQSILFGGDK